LVRWLVDSSAVMLSAAALMAPVPAAPKSSLEVLLETIKKRDEQPKDEPPALPARPTCRGRLPRARRSPTPPRVENGVAEQGAVVDTAMADKKPEVVSVKKPEIEKEKTPEVKKEIGEQEAKAGNVVNGRIFGAKRKICSVEPLDESQYVENFNEASKDTMACSKEPSSPYFSSARAKRNGKPMFTDSMDYVLQKVRISFIVKSMRFILFPCVRSNRQYIGTSPICLYRREYFSLL
jgi:myosin-5